MIPEESDISGLQFVTEYKRGRDGCCMTRARVRRQMKEEALLWQRMTNPKDELVPRKRPFHPPPTQ